MQEINKACIGYIYLQEAIQMKRKYPLRKTCEIYKVIGRKHKKSWQSIEYAIRYCLKQSGIKRKNSYIISEEAFKRNDAK